MKIECFQEEYPAKLLQIKEYPIQIYCRGNVSLLNNHKTIAIVGSRDSTEYGRKYAEKFAKELSKSNICIISGLALGIDTSAHLGAMKGTGNTIAVLGGGFNDIYPKQNLWLYDEILNNNGCVITEYGENEETRKSNFPKRNRIISGIADAVLVIEASTRSGSKITARYAREQGKKVYCIPKDLDSKNSSGINELLKEGAKLITTPRQLISDLYNEKIEIEEHNKKQIPEKYEQIYKLIENNLSKEELSIQLDMNMENLNSLLTMMELEGLIEQVPGGRFKRK